MMLIYHNLRSIHFDEIALSFLIIAFIFIRSCQLNSLFWFLLLLYDKIFAIQCNRSKWFCSTLHLLSRVGTKLFRCFAWEHIRHKQTHYQLQNADFASVICPNMTLYLHCRELLCKSAAYIILRLKQTVWKILQHPRPKAANCNQVNTLCSRLLFQLKTASITIKNDHLRLYNDENIVGAFLLVSLFELQT